MSDMNKIMECAFEAANRAGKVLREGQMEPLLISYKGEINLVTSMDKKSEEIITSYIHSQFPHHRVVAEEGSDFPEDSEYVWYIDPLDGTTNYAHGLPWYAVSIGLLKNGEPHAGLIYNPANGEIFHAIKGGGAFKNGKKISVSQRSEILKCLLVTGFPYYKREKPERILENFEKFLLSCRGVRRFGAAALDLAYIAAGCYDGYWEEGLKPWDTAAGILLVTEAGGVVSDYKGGEYDIFGDTIVASNGLIHSEMLKLL